MTKTTKVLTIIGPHFMTFV